MVNDMFFHLWGVTIEYYIITQRVVQQFNDTINCNIIAIIYIYIYIQLHLHIIYNIIILIMTIIIIIVIIM